MKDVDLARDVFSALCMLVGAGFCVLASVGLWRFPDVICRLHAASKGQTLGLLLVLLGTAAQVPGRYAVAVLLVVVFQLAMAPVTGQIVGRTAYRTRAVHRPGLAPDELARRLAADERRQRRAQELEQRRGEQERGQGRGSEGRSG